MHWATAYPFWANTSGGMSKRRKTCAVKDVGGAECSTLKAIILVSSQGKSCCLVKGGESAVRLLTHLFLLGPRDIDQKKKWLVTVMSSADYEHRVMSDESPPVRQYVKWSVTLMLSAGYEHRVMSDDSPPVRQYVRAGRIDPSLVLGPQSVFGDKSVKLQVVYPPK